MLILIQILKHFKTKKEREAIESWMHAIFDLEDVQDFLDACGVDASETQKNMLLSVIQSGKWQSAFHLASNNVI